MLPDKYLGAGARVASRPARERHAHAAMRVALCWMIGGVESSSDRQGRRDGPCDWLLTVSDDAFRYFTTWGGVSRPPTVVGLRVVGVLTPLTGWASALRRGDPPESACSN